VAYGVHGVAGRGKAVAATASIAVALSTIAACLSVAGGGPPGDGQRSGDAASGGPRVGLTVFAAASLKAALKRLRPVYESSHPSVTLTVSTDSSAALETQIEQGAPADVFLSADTANPAKLLDAGLADGKPVPFAANELTVIVPVANPAHIGAAADMGRSGVRVVAAGNEVPITRYAERLVANLAAQPGYPRDFAGAYSRNVVSREDNVRAVVAKIELGEGDVAIAYLTDAKASSRVRSIPIPDGLNIRAMYAGVVVKASQDPAAAHAFLDWLAGSDGRAILGQLGFLPVPES
jgi:molybdate transport system substrate-binding protein